MGQEPTKPTELFRDGTSQRGRALRALDPEYARIDERTIQDLLAFAREYGERIVYVGPDDKAAGTWSELIGDVDPEEVAELLCGSAAVDKAAAPELSRPHFVLFLVFLKLYKRAQDKINTLTARHLDFYYRLVLGMTKKGPTADRASLIFELARGEREAKVPEGSLVSAGPDALHRPRVYRTDRELTVSRIRIEKIRAVRLDRRRAGLRDAWRAHKEDREGACREMFEIALGEPRPGGPVPPLPGDPPGDNLYSKLTALAGALSSLDLPAIRDEIKLNPAELSAPAKKVREVDDYFSVAAERFLGVMAEITDENKPVVEWREVFSFLEQAYTERNRARRLARIKEQQGTEETLYPLLRFVLGKAKAPEDEAELVDQIQPFLSAADFQTLQSLTKPSNPTEWERAYGLLEVAQRNRLGEPKAERVEWINLHSSENVAVDGALPALGGDQTPRFATFGLLPGADGGAAPAPSLGWAITASLLSLALGERTVTLSLGFREDLASRKLEALLKEKPSETERWPFLVEVSTAEGWIECPSARFKSNEQKESGAERATGLVTIELELSFDRTFPPIAPLPAKEGDIVSPWPALRLMLRVRGDEGARATTISYEDLRDLGLVSAGLRVHVTGLLPRFLQNDEATLDAKKPFEPFGSAPSRGSRLRIGHPEVVGEQIDSLTLRGRWMGAPVDPSAYYADYKVSDDEPALVDPSRFTSRICLVDGGEERELVKEKPIFSGTSSEEVAIEVPAESASGLFSKRAKAGTGTDRGDPSTGGRYLQWELDGSDFGHEAYPRLATAKAIELAAAIANKRAGTTIDAAKYQINPPYTPKLKDLTLEYHASLSVSLAAPPGEREARILHIHPFGYCDARPELGVNDTAAGVPFLPSYDNDGELYLGLRDVETPSSVSLLFQLAEGSADPDRAAASVEWSYLDGDEFRPFERRAIEETTRNLASTGIVMLPLEPVSPGTRLKGGLYWIRASVKDNLQAVCDTIDIQPHAVTATFVDPDGAPGHDQAPLPPRTITKAISRIQGIVGVRQPYASRGGRPAESDAMWNIRVSERLRHKGRALAMWDYERLVLERFPEIYKVRCLPAEPDEPGRVELVVIPDLRRLGGSDPERPRAPRRLLSEIESYLSTKKPSFATVRVRNARFVETRVRLAVRFTSDGNEAFNKQTLNEDLRRFLAPWAFDDGQDIMLGGRIYTNSIVDLVDRRPYVDYVASVRLFRRDYEHESWVMAKGSDREGESIDAGSPDAVLVSYPTHDIEVLHDAAYEERKGIGYMKIDLDFIVGGPALPGAR